MTKTVKDNLKEHLVPYSEKDVQKIREEKTQLVTAEEFKAVHRHMLEQTSDLEKKLATAVAALKEINEGFWNSATYGFIVDVPNEEPKNLHIYIKQVLAEIGGE